MNFSRPIILALAFTWALDAQFVPKMFEPVPLSQVVPPRAPQMAAKRTRHVVIDNRLFTEEAAVEQMHRARMPQQVENRIELNLFDDVTLKAIFDRAEYAGNQQRTTLWYGHIDKMSRGHVVLAVTGKTVSGTVNTDDGAVFQIMPTEDMPVHTVSEMDFNRLPPDGPPIPVFTGAADTVQTAAGDDGSIVDIMVVYTAAARAAAGSTAAMQNLVALGIAETNQGYANSGIIQRARLVYSGEVNYTETGKFNDDLDRLTRTSDGYIDNVHTLRDQYRADVVSLWVNSGDYCGLAWLMTTASNAFASSAFSVVRRDCATGYYSFAHEMGHNQGATHDVANSGGAGIFPYSYGYQQKNQTPYFRTVMAYACSGVTCNRVNYWSNPSGVYQGIATGTSTTNNTRSMNETRNTVANWRQASTTPSTLSISPGTASFASTGGNGSITVTATAGLTWTASRSDTWITLVNSTGTGNGTINYTVAVNNAVTQRIGTITVSSSAGTQSHSITQSGASLTCTTQPIAFGQTINATFTTSDCRSQIRGNAYYAKRYTFFGIAGQQVVIAMDSTGATSFDTYLYLLGPSGQEETRDDDGGPGLNSRIPPNSGYHALQATGTYTIEATSWSSQATGSFALSLNGIGGSACTYAISPPTGSVGSGASTGTITITTQAGCSWSASSSQPSWLVINSQGSGAGPGTVTYNVLANTSTSSRSATITVQGQTFNLTQSGAPAGTCAALPIGIGQTVNGSLVGTCLSQYRSASHYAQRYTFAANSGQQVRILLTSPTLDTYLYLVSPNGFVIAYDDDSAGNLNSVIPSSGYYTLTASGTYTIEATTYDSFATGAITVSITAGVGPSAASQKIGLFRQTTGMWLLDANGDGGWSNAPPDILKWLGQNGDIALVGDWNGDGRAKIGFFRPSTGMWLIDYNGNGFWDGPTLDRLTWLGQNGDTPLVGDWNNDGRDEIGFFRNGMWLLDYNGDYGWNNPAIDRLYWLGQAGDVPVVGDWNSDGRYEIGFFRPAGGMWLLDYNGDGGWSGLPADRLGFLGQFGDMPVVGDWTGDGYDKIGLFRPATGMWLLDLNNDVAWSGGALDRISFLGQFGDTPLVGDWNGDGKKEIGFFRAGMWLLDFNGDGGWSGTAIDRLYWLGQAGDTPLVGRWQ